VGNHYHWTSTELSPPCLGAPANDHLRGLAQIVYCRGILHFFAAGGAAEPSTQLPNPNDLAIYVALKKLARSVVTDVALIVDQVCREVQIDFRLR
jgi:hypothetical protein